MEGVQGRIMCELERPVQVVGRIAVLCLFEIVRQCLEAWPDSEKIVGNAFSYIIEREDLGCFVGLKGI